MMLHDCLPGVRLAIASAARDGQPIPARSRVEKALERPPKARLDLLPTPFEARSCGKSKDGNLLTSPLGSSYKVGTPSRFSASPLRARTGAWLAVRAAIASETKLPEGNLKTRAARNKTTMQGEK